jgi:hypothetical protein
MKLGDIFNDSIVAPYHQLVEIDINCKNEKD